ncbi:hypothetical protein ASA1KI_21000 [Opitutales bacterium ASA1]|uniref:helix-turn-helix domain-containing protein n=1 Tax=Congregicoccus parvus TaxID=3081749 RepID=UPI002B291DDE|nr:hypothetical protein ASA1KI_21000 [Opitutales bacterium ASA1]
MIAPADRHFERRELLARARLLINEHGMSQGEAARELGVSAPTLSRLLAAYRAGGTADLAPKYDRCGRKKLTVGATEEDRAALKRLKLATDSDALALALWADDARCSPALRAAIQRPRKSRHNLPASLRQLCFVTEDEKRLFRGEKAFQLGGFVQQRDDTVVLADGTRRPIEAGDLWELDDMSNNQPFWWEWLAEEIDDPAAHAQARLALRQAAAVGRQVLFARDVKSGRWLGFEIVGRPRDAYRAADVLRFLRRLFETYGLPRLGLRLERGVWKAKVIAGITLDDAGAEIARPEMSEDERTALFGGLQEIGVSIDWCHSPKHKGGIEGAFNHLQSVMAAQAVCGSDYVVDLGRKRGEFERGTKALLAAHAGRKHPRELGFWHIDTARERLTAACAWINSAEHKEGRIAQGVADGVWENSIRRAPLRALPKDKLWIFLPHESECALRGAHVRGQIGGVVHHFCAPALAAELGAAYPVRIRFDATEPSLGAWIFNNAPADARCNVAGRRLGEFIGWAEFAPDAPQFDMQHGFDGRNRKRYDAHVRAMFAAIGLHGRKAPIAAEQRDGAGGVNRIEFGGGQPRLAPDRGQRAEGGGQPEAPAVVRRPSSVVPPRALPAEEDLDALEARLRAQGALIG